MHKNEENFYIPQIQKKCAERKKIMKKDVKRENAKKAKVMGEKFQRKANEVAEKLVEEFDGKSTAMKIAMVVFVVLSVISLFWTIKISIIFLCFAWKYLGLKQVIITSIVVAIVVEEIRKNGVLSLLVKVAAIILFIKVAGELTNVDTTSIDIVLKWIAKIPEFVTSELTPLKF